jgi:dynein regulatory complex protein 1
MRRTLSDRLVAAFSCFCVSLSTPDPRAASALKDKAADEAEALRSMASKVQITASRSVVDAALLAGTNALSDVFLEREHSEAQRRRREAQARQERFDRVDAELEQSRVVNEELEARWDSVAAHDIPQELYAAISAQYKQASQLLAGKDELIKFLQTQLRHGDEEYVELLSQHQEDVNQALKRLSANFASFHATVRKELHHVEETFMKERAELLEKNREEIEALFEKRRKMEVSRVLSQSVGLPRGMFCAVMLIFMLLFALFPSVCGMCVCCCLMFFSVGDDGIPSSARA